ncbi:MAG: hypothetical protein IK063_07170 [Clostridia bacterium]|nr:hypothetical protein [Clostridia bacterium]
MYYTQNEGLMRDAKRTELESAVARMVVARIKAHFIGGKLQIARMIVILLSVAALLVPFGTAHYTVPFFDGSFSAGLIGLIQGFTGGLLMKIPALLGSTLFAGPTLFAVICTGLVLVCVIIDLVMAAAFFLGFLNITKCAKIIRNASLAGAVFSAVSQVAILVLGFVHKGNATADFKPGFGALVCLAVYLVIFFISSAILKKGIEPKFRENDLKRKEMLKKVRAGEVDIDTLPIPVYESEEEREERLKALEEALKVEEEGKEL